MNGFNQSDFGIGSGGGGGGGGTVDAAENGVSLLDDGSTVILGQSIGDPDMPALLNFSVEVPLNGNTVDFSDAGTGGTVQIAPNAVNFNNVDGKIASSAGQGITLDTNGKIDMGVLPSPGVADAEVFAQVRGNTTIGGWLLNQIRINASQDDTTATEADSGTLYIKVFDGIAGDRTITLPPAVPGLIYHFGYSGNGTVFINVVPDGTDFIWFGINSPFPTAAGGGIRNNNPGIITLVCIVAGEWLNMSQTSNTWVAI